jgi:signal transduction histidine kinase/putative methionine-R-sulfoxide reductase with GAF domain
MTTHPSSGVFPIPDPIRTATRPESPASAPGVEAGCEQLQVADTVETIVEIVRDVISRRPGVGRGAVYLVCDRQEAVRRAFIQGPASADLSLPEIELTGMARRAIREGISVRQSGVAAGTLWASPLRSAEGVEGVVAAVGEPGEVGMLLAHAGFALGRERRRERDLARARAAESRADDLERAVDILDEIVRDAAAPGVLRRIATCIAGIAGLGRVAAWTLRPEDGRYVEIAAAEGSGQPSFVLPEAAHRAEGFLGWSATFPRWGGFPWIPRGTIQRLSPGNGDTLLLVLGSQEAKHPLGFLVAEVEQPLETAQPLEDLRRWVTLARHATESGARRGRSQQRLDDLREEKEQLAELHRMKSQFIAAVSHELRTPLTSISAYAETLRSGDVRTEEATRDRFLRVIHDESRRLTRIVDDILDLATMDAGRVRMSCRRIDLREIVDDALDVIRPLAEEKRIQVRSLTSDDACVHADGDLLKQLAVNLLENAVKFTPANGNVEVTLEADATAVRLVVQDDGPGVPIDKLDAIFERFYQVDGSNERSHGGSGLGLAIARSIATWHDGRIWAESGDGEGARFVVSLPRVRATSRARAAEPTVDNAPADEHRVPELMIEMIAEVVRAESVSLMLLEPSGSELFVQAALGMPDEAIREVRLAVGERIAGSVAKDGKTLLIPDLDADDRFGRSERRSQYRTRSLISVPVMVRGSVIGVINVTNKISGGSFDEQDRRLLEILAQRVALVLNKLRDFGDSRDDIRRMEEAMRGVIDVRRHYFPTGDDFPDLVLSVSRELGLDVEQATRIHYASILRDVGMTRLPEGSYKKPSELTERDRALIRTHPEIAARVLRSIEFLPDVFDIILAHHEQPGGSGYPRGLTDGGIPLGAKILAVVDAFDALRAGRPYRDSVSESDAFDELRRNAGRQFDPAVVEALVRVVERSTDRVLS